MIKKTLFLVFFLAFRLAVAQEIDFHPLASWKSAPPAAITLLKSQQLKPKKATWSVAGNGVYFALFQKKGQEQFAYYFHSDGSFLYKRYPIAARELPSSLRDRLGERLNAEGTRIYTFSGLYFPVYCICIPRFDGTFADEYITADGEPYDMIFK
jgi:hypothetical protein